MRFAVYSEIGEQSIRESLGRPEYSYYFVLRSFLPALERIGAITHLRDPATDLDPIFAECAARGEPCLFISFSPPHKAFVAHDHPMIVVFAWEFSTIPDEVWGDDPRNDWRTVLARHGRAITLSSYTARVVKAAMGPDFPILAASGTVWDRFASVRARSGANPIIAPTELRLEGLILDSRELDLSPEYLLRPEPPIPEPPARECPLVAPQPETAAAEDVAEEPRSELVTAKAAAGEKGETVLAAIPSAVPKKSFRYRLGMTKHYSVEWYREVIRDLLPRWLVWIISRIGRLIYRLAWHSLTQRPPASSPAPEVAVELAGEPAHENDVTAVEPTEQLEQPERRWPEARVTIDGLVYTSVFNPTDGRKNYKDLITAFCWAFRDVKDATLVLKMVQGDLARWYHPYIQMLSQLSPLKCRVIALHGYLEECEYRKLIEATTYYVNASCCEGLCLPLMEFMSCRRPAVAPNHTAMEDYVDGSNAFVVAASPEHNVWPHDPRDLFRTERYRIDWESLLEAYNQSYRVAKEQPSLYAKMQENASRAMQAISSDESVAGQLERFLGLAAGGEPLNESRHVAMPPQEVMAK